MTIEFRSSFLGIRIILRQVSPESEAIYDLILSLYHACDGNWARIQELTGVTEEELKHFLEYAVQFLGNLGNYKGFGDSKFVPRCSPNTLEALASISPDGKQFFEKTKVNGAGIYADIEQPALMHLGFPDQGHITEYYPDSPDIAEWEIELLGKFLAGKKLLPENTRIRKQKNGNFDVLVASGIHHPLVEEGNLSPGTVWSLSGRLEGRSLELKYGDHVEEMAKIALHMKKARLHVANDTQRQMIGEYVKSFETGSLSAFKESQRYWVQDLEPMVESNIGFIETYRDPIGLRAEWEGLGETQLLYIGIYDTILIIKVAMVNKERTKALWVVNYVLELFAH